MMRRLRRGRHIRGVVGRVARRFDPLLVRVLGWSWMSHRVARLVGIEPVPTLLLRTSGKSGDSHDAAVFYGILDERPVVVGSWGGRPRDPRWVRDLRQNPHAIVWVRRRRQAVRAVELEGEQRDRALRVMTDLYPAYAEYQVTAGDRLLPVFRLEERLS
jgi:deazaflavin-dependent oxidoreductase (nitroreductase family)